MSHPLGEGVLVLGMHRSGTSAVTGVIDRLGLPACRKEDRFAIFPANPRGNHESRSLSFFDEFLLRRLGGRWWAPVDPPAGWELDPGVLPLLEQARTLFASAHPTPRWVWKDPRACLLLPFWDRVLGTGLPRILVLRPPMEIAASLARRDRMPVAQSLAATERYLHSALADSAGCPVMITRYDDLLADPAGWCELCAEFLEANGLGVGRPPALEAVGEFLAEDLRHHRVSEAAGASNTLWLWADERVGVHPSLSVAGLPGESADTGRILRAALGSARPASVNG